MCIYRFVYIYIHMYILNLELSTAVGGRTREHRAEPGAHPLAWQESHASKAGRLLTCLTLDAV